MKSNCTRLGAALGGAAFLAIGVSAAFAGQPAPPTGPVHPAATPKGSYATLENLPDWGGVWVVAFGRAPGPALEPIAPKGKYKEERDRLRKYADENNGVVPLEFGNCTPPGTPGIMGVGQYPMEVLFTPGRVTTLHEAWTGQRKIFTDGRKHTPADELDPSFYGESIGHWEGQTLVVRTIGIKTITKVGGVGHSDKLVVDERIYLDPTNPNVLIDEITSTDPEALEKPFKQIVRWNRRRDIDLLEFICAENDRNPLGPDGLVQFNH